MREVELEFPSKATEAKKYFYFHDKKQRINNHIDFESVYHSNNANTLLYWYFTHGKKIFGEKAFAVESFTVSTLIPKYPKIVLIVKISKLQELIMNILYFKSCFISMFLSNQCKNISIARTNSTKTGRKLSTIFLSCWIAKTENSPKI